MGAANVAASHAQITAAFRINAGPFLETIVGETVAVTLRATIAVVVNVLEVGHDAGTAPTLELAFTAA